MSEKAIPVGHIPSGLFIVCTVDDEGQKDGFLASWVQQVSFDPLLITMALKEGRVCYDHILAGKPFSINIVGDDQASYLRHFWKGYPSGQGPFDQIPHDISEHGTIKIKDAKSVIECKMLSSSKPGDHNLIVAEVIDGTELNSDVKPKTYIRKSGLDY
ncbi:MAG: flavin reductase [Deltaproteobacteria bacterium]|nr:MAG: flavin reductase [Deltaproteobacteria bacterium]